MFKKNAIRVASVGVIAAALVGASALSASAADEPVATVGSTGPLYILDAGTGDLQAEGSTLAWNYQVVGSIDPTDLESVFPGPADATEVRTFISPRGSERTPSAWTAYATGGFFPGTQNVLLPTLTLEGQTNGNGASIKANGGNYSVGFAYLNNNGLSIASDSVYYTYITVTPGTGAWKFATPSTEEPPAEPSGSFDVNLEATTINAVDGTLNLVAPTNATAAIGNPTLVNGLSTSTGTLGQFSVEDGRVVTHPGWTLTTTVTDFANSADASKIIANKQLGLAPKLVEANAAVTLATAQTAGSAVYPSVFAQTDDSAAVATTKFDADLTFVSPANMPAGTYTSKLTLTLASK